MPQLPTEPQKVVIPAGNASSDQTSMRWSGQGNPWWFVSNAQTRLGRMIPEYTLAFTPHPDVTSDEVLIRQQIREFLENRAIFDQPFTVIASDRELWVDGLAPQADRFVNITPIHTDGTVDVVNGSNIVTGNGTSWVTRGISSGSFFSTDGITWYAVSVQGETTLEISGTTYQGPTDSGSNYAIRRRINNSGAITPNLDSNVGVFMQMRLSNLYVAAPLVFVEGPTPGTFAFKNDFCLVRYNLGIKEDFSNSLFGTNFDQTFLLGGSKVPEIGTQIVGKRITVLGMGLMDSGHILLLTREWDEADPEASTAARLRWSSPVNDAEWLNNPAGFLDIPHPPGTTTALIETERGFELHFTHGILLAVPTGLTIQPVAPRRTRASFGAAHPRAVARRGGVTYFLDVENNIRAWDGQRDQVIVDGLHVRSVLQFKNTDNTDVPPYFATLPNIELSYLQPYDALVVYGVEAGGPGSDPTLWESHMLVVNLSDGSVISRNYPGRVRGVSTNGVIGGVTEVPFPQSPSPTLSYRQYERQLPIGLQEQARHKIEGITKLMDFGYPGYLKTITRVAFNFRGEAAETLHAFLGSGQTPSTFPDEWLYRFRTVDAQEDLIPEVVPEIHAFGRLQQVVWYPNQDDTQPTSDPLGDQVQQARESWILGFHMFAHSPSGNDAQLDSIEIEFQVLGNAEIDMPSGT